MIYLDYAGHKPTPFRVAQLIASKIRIDKYYNPSTNTALSKYSKFVLDKTRKDLLQYIGVSDEDYSVIFTSSGCESNSLAIKGSIDGYNAIITTPIEHSSIRNLRVEGHEMILLPLDKNGHISIDAYIDVLSKNRNSVVSVQCVNNETGIKQNIYTLSKIAHEHGCLFHTDMVQAFGKMKIDYNKYDDAEYYPDMISISGHKIGAFSGVGALIVRKGIILNGLISGTQEGSVRGGTENVIGIDSLRLAMQYDSMKMKNAILYDKKRIFLSVFDSECKKNDIKYKVNKGDVDYIISITIDNVNAEKLIAVCEKNGVVISAGSACSTGKQSYVLRILGYDVYNTIRVSFDAYTSLNDLIDGAKKIVKSVCEI